MERRGSARAIVEATLEALRHTVGRDEHRPHLKRLVEGQIRPVTFAEIADGLASIDVSSRDPEWREVWTELIETLGAVPSAEGKIPAAVSGRCRCIAGHQAL